jgi:hypothetical protein
MLKANADTHICKYIFGTVIVPLLDMLDRGVYING